MCGEVSKGGRLRALEEGHALKTAKKMTGNVYFQGHSKNGNFDGKIEFLKSN